MIVMDATVSPSKLQRQLQFLPCPVGASTVTVGVDVYPVPPDPTVMVSTD